MLSPASVLYFNETGETMQDVLSSSIRAQQIAIVQEHGRYYALTVVRWFAEVFSELSDLTSLNAIPVGAKFIPHSGAMSNSRSRLSLLGPTPSLGGPCILPLLRGVSGRLTKSVSYTHLTLPTILRV